MRKRNLMMNVFFIPAMVLFAIFVVYPFLNGVRLSFTNWNGYSPHMKNIGLMNYKRMFTDKNVLVAFRNTLIYGFWFNTDTECVWNPFGSISEHGI
jgi:raffinose/stachyose/melibiose transport system permease protein